jgi:hypothetical protein
MFTCSCGLDWAKSTLSEPARSIMLTCKAFLSAYRSVASVYLLMRRVRIEGASGSLRETR